MYFPKRFKKGQNVSHRELGTVIVESVGNVYIWFEGYEEAYYMHDCKEIEE